MADLAVSIYVCVAAVVFVVTCFTFEESYGRGTTGRTDFTSALFVAAGWLPILALMMIAGIYLLYSRRKEPE